MPTIQTRGQRRDCRCPRARHVHGTNRAYTADRCRCARCRDAHRTYAAHTRRLTAYGRWNRWTHPDGAVRRIRALHALGWPMTAIGHHVGIDPSHVRRLARGVHGRRLRRDLHDRIAATYDALSMRTPTVPARERTRARSAAAAAGWAPPLAWDDDAIDVPDARPEQLDGATRFGVAPCGTHAAFNRHKKRGERVDNRCVLAERAYQAARPNRRRTRQEIRAA